MKGKVLRFLSGLLLGAASYFFAGVLFKGEEKWLPIWGMMFIMLPFFVLYAHKDGRARKEGNGSQFVKKYEGVFLLCTGWIAFYVFFLKLVVNH